MKPIDRISVEELRNHISYNPETGLIIWESMSRNRRRVKGSVCGSLGSDGYYRIMINRVSVASHRAAWALYYGKWPDGYLDHINRDKTDNRIANLRAATASQNSANRGISKNNTCGLKGVTLTRHGKWMAQAMTNKCNKYLGTFNTKEEAHNVYKNYVESLYGEFVGKMSILE